MESKKQESRASRLASGILESGQDWRMARTEEWPGLENGQDWRMAGTGEWPVPGLGGKIGPHLTFWWKEGGYSGIEMKEQRA